MRATIALLAVLAVAAGCGESTSGDDAGAPADSGAVDAGAPDSGIQDAGLGDAGVADAGGRDGGAPDGAVGACAVSRIAAGRRLVVNYGTSTIDFSTGRFYSEYWEEIGYTPYQFYQWWTADDVYGLELQIYLPYVDSCPAVFALPTSDDVPANLVLFHHPDSTTWNTLAASEVEGSTGTLTVDSYTIDPNVYSAGFKCESCVLKPSPDGPWPATVTGEAFGSL